MRQLAKNMQSVMHGDVPALPPATRAARVLNYANPASAHVCVVQLCDGVLHVSQRCKLGNSAYTVAAMRVTFNIQRSDT